MPQRYATSADLPAAFASVDADVASYWLDFTQSFIDLPTWGADASKGHAMVAAHFLSLAGEGVGGSQAGAIKQQSVGDVSVTYATPEGSDPEWSRTGYGSTYLAMKRMLVPVAKAARSNSFNLRSLRR